jgi:outer membrane biosynthesis protein TonB
MSFRNWLLTGTSLTLLAFAPLGAARAQDATDPALIAAYQAFQADQNDSTQQALTEACIAAGFQSLDDCIAALSGVAPVQEEAAPPPAEPAPSAEEPAPPVEEPAAPVEEPAPPVEEPAPPVEEPTPPPVEEPAPVEQPSAEQAAPEQPATEEPVQEETPAVEEPAVSSEEAAPVSSEEVAPVSSEEPAVDVLVQLTGSRRLSTMKASPNSTPAMLMVSSRSIDAQCCRSIPICTAAGFADTASAALQTSVSN